jgi:hypothetical protein
MSDGDQDSVVSPMTPVNVCTLNDQFVSMKYSCYSCVFK